jgi:hypothetical protein
MLYIFNIYYFLCLRIDQYCLAFYVIFVLKDRSLIVPYNLFRRDSFFLGVPVPNVTINALYPVRAGTILAPSMMYHISERP